MNKAIGFVIVAMLLIVSLSAVAQTAQEPQPPQNLYGFGPNYSQAGSPAVSGTFIYSHKVSDSGTYAFSLMDVAAGQRTPGKLVPTTLRTNIIGGVAQQLAKIGKVPIYGTVGIGPSFTSENTGGSVSFGGMAPIRYKQTNWFIAPNLRATRSNVDASGEVKIQAGVFILWGQ